METMWTPPCTHIPPDAHTWYSVSIQTLTFDMDELDGMDGMNEGLRLTLSHTAFPPPPPASVSEMQLRSSSSSSGYLISLPPLYGVPVRFLLMKA